MLYQSGDYEKHEVTTSGEKELLKILLGKQEPYAFPQYNSNGGDDFIPELPLLKFILPPRIYLTSYPGEIQYVYLIKDQNKNILGAAIYLYGD